MLFAAVGASLVEKGTMAWYARLRGVPALMFPRGGAVIDQFQRSSVMAVFFRIAFGGARMMLCQSERWQEFACKALGFAPEAAPVILNWTALPTLTRIGHARQPRSFDSPVRLLFLGWMDEEKGIQELLEACRALAPTRRFTLAVAGEGNWSQHARSFVKIHDLGSVVSFSGWLRGPDVHQALDEADVLLLPSWSEGLPNSMVEAMAAGLAVVVSAVGSVPDVIADGENGLLVRPRDTVALTQTLARVLDDSELRWRLGRTACEFAEQKFGVEPAADRLMAAIHRVVSPARKPRTA
jgi:glycosyltransferase involved in cell wall biosynthesis